jgi:cytochrome c-type biogenesis protein CcmH/NrfF
VGLGVLFVILRQRRKMMQRAPVLSADDHARAASLLSGKEGEGHS